MSRNQLKIKMQWSKINMLIGVQFKLQELQFFMRSRGTVHETHANHVHKYEESHSKLTIIHIVNRVISSGSSGRHVHKALGGMFSPTVKENNGLIIAASRLLSTKQYDIKVFTRISYHENNNVMIVHDWFGA